MMACLSFVVGTRTQESFSLHKTMFRMLTQAERVSILCFLAKSHRHEVSMG